MPESHDPDTTPALPAVIPVFPLTGAIVLPRGSLPLNIFEPRYLAMVRDAIASHKFIGMVQPLPESRESDRPKLHTVGCAGRIVEHSETPDGRILITLEGTQRFRIAEELDVTTPYRQARLVPGAYLEDLQHPGPLPADMKLAIKRNLRNYLDSQDMQADWSAIDKAEDESLVTALSVICPFAAVEKQALLEAVTLLDRARLLDMLLQFTEGSSDMSELRH